MTDSTDNLEFLQAVCDACLEVAERLDLSAHELIVAVAANLGRPCWFLCTTILSQIYFRSRAWAFLYKMR